MRQSACEAGRALIANASVHSDGWARLRARSPEHAQIISRSDPNSPPLAMLGHRGHPKVECQYNIDSED